MSSIPFICTFLLLTFFQNRDLKNREPVSYGYDTHKMVSCAYPEGKPVTGESDVASEGRCTGSASCTACKNCNYCKYCNSGGSCGVCGGGTVTRYRPSSGTTSGKSRGDGGTTPNRYNPAGKPARRTVFLPAVATVTAVSLNVRSGPGTQYTIITRLSAGDSVIVVDTAGDNWVKIEIYVSNEDGIKKIEGYVSRKYISF